MLVRWRRPVVALLATFVWIQSQAQTVSPLQQVMSTSSLISRPQVFRDMQEDIVKKARGMTPGLHLDEFYKDMSDARTMFLQRLHEARLKLEFSMKFDTLFVRLDSTYLLMMRRTETLVNTSAMLDLLKPVAADLLHRRLNDLVNGAFRDSKQQALVSELFRVLNTSGLSSVSYSANGQDECLKGIASILVDYAIEYLKDKIKVESPSDLLARLDEFRAAELGARLQKLINEGLDDLEQRILKALDKVEYTVSNAIASASSYLVKGNTGFGITKGNGSFGGGIYAAYAIPWFKAGVYVNTQFGKEDTNRTVALSLYGIHAQIAGNKWQLDLLVSYLRGSPDESKQEYGAGLSCRVAHGLIIGGALYVQGPRTGLASYGVFVTPTAAGAPSLFFGVTHKGGNFLVQTSFPIGTSD